jgi:CheY-like chemotaxis protein
MARPFLLVEDSYAEVQALVGLLKRIGLMNPVTVQSTVASAQEFLTACAPAQLPVLIFMGTGMRGGHSLDLLDWLHAQASEMADIPAIALLETADDPGRSRAAAAGVAMVARPIEMYALIAAMKTLGLAEKVKIDSTTLMVQVELCPRAGR